MSIKDLYKKITDKKLDVVPSGWKTAAQIALEEEISESRAAQILIMLVREGMYERKKFFIRTGEVVRQVWHYRAKKVKKNS